MKITTFVKSCPLFMSCISGLFVWTNVTPSYACTQVNCVRFVDDPADPPISLIQARKIFERFQSICDSRDYDKLVDIFADDIDQYYEDYEIKATDLIKQIKEMDAESGDTDTYVSKVIKFESVKGDENAFRYEIESKCLSGEEKGTITKDVGIVRFVLERGKYKIYYIESLSEA